MTAPLTRPMITISIMLATILQTLDSTIANVALPHMQGSLSASQDQIAWVLTAYIVAAAIATPLTGFLCDRFGQKTVFLVSVAGFTIASALCGVSESLGQIVAARLLQGVFGAAPFEPVGDRTRRLGADPHRQRRRLRRPHAAASWRQLRYDRDQGQFLPTDRRELRPWPRGGTRNWPWAAHHLLRGAGGRRQGPPSCAWNLDADGARGRRLARQTCAGGGLAGAAARPGAGWRGSSPALSSAIKAPWRSRALLSYGGAMLARARAQ